MFCCIKRYLLAILKKCKVKSRMICLICSCILFFFLISNHSKSKDLTIEIDPIYISKMLSSLIKESQADINNGDISHSVHSNIDFDPNLPNLRKRILISINSSNLESLQSNNLQNSIPNNRSFLNVYVWRDHCLDSIDFLKVKLGFPYNPWKKYFTHDLILQTQYEMFGQRIFGFLIPPISGKYSMEVTFSGNIEIWISPDYHPSLSVKHDLSLSESFIIERKAFLLTNLVAKRRQYFEIIHASKEKCVLEVKWKRPDSNEYQPIESNYLRPYISEYDYKSISVSYCDSPSHVPDPQIRQYFHPTDERDLIYALQTVDIDELGNQKTRAIPLCEYRPSYTERTSITHANSLPLLSTHPATEFYPREVAWGKDTIISQSLKDSIIRSFMYHLTFSYPNVQLSRIINIERLADPINGDLYLLEVLVVIGESSDRELLISEYVVLGHGSLPRMILCQATAMKMHRDTFVHFLVTHRNFAYMLREFILNMERIYIETGDENFGVILVNYPTPDIDVESLMERSKLKHWSIIEMDGPWEKTAAINLGIDSVSSPDDIIFSTDLSLHIPSYLPNSIRKHTFQGYSGFVPIVFYFDCDPSIDSYIQGYYSINGFGLISLYKSDWQKVGGMDTTRFKGKWGLEDNDVADRIVASGFVLFRLVMRDFYHQNHSYSGLWED